MNIKVFNVKPANDEDIDSFEKESGFALPDELKCFFLKFNGAEPEVNVFEINRGNASGVNEFLDISRIIEERSYIYEVGENVFPIAVAEGGNYVVVRFEESKQSILFWDHESPLSMVKLADSVYEFLSLLSPFDPSSVELREGQVEFAWIDPEFLKQNQ